MIYCISDIHGQYQAYLALLNKIGFKESDTLYVLGDVLDRGPEPFKVLKDMMQRPNVYPIVGNHEYVGVKSMNILLKEIDDAFVKSFNEEQTAFLESWFKYGGETTFSEFVKLYPKEREEYLSYISEFSLYEEVTVGGRQFILVHAGLGNFEAIKPLEDYNLLELAFDRADYGIKYFEDKFLVTGHTPTSLIDESCKDDTIFMKNNHIAIDCGSVFGGKLAAICLDTLEEFYV